MVIVTRMAFRSYVTVTLTISNPLPSIVSPYASPPGGGNEVLTKRVESAAYAAPPEETTLSWP